MQSIVDRSEATAERKKRPQMVAVYIEISISQGFLTQPTVVLIADQFKNLLGEQ